MKRSGYYVIAIRDDTYMRLLVGPFATSVAANRMVTAVRHAVSDVAAYSGCNIRVERYMQPASRRGPLPPGLLDLETSVDDEWIRSITR